MNKLEANSQEYYLYVSEVAIPTHLQGDVEVEEKNCHTLEYVT
jgi:hypothetical protein